MSEAASGPASALGIILQCLCVMRDLELLRREIALPRFRAHRAVRQHLLPESLTRLQSASSPTLLEISGILPMEASPAIVKLLGWKTQTAFRQLSVCFLLWLKFQLYKGLSLFAGEIQNRQAVCR